ncbi:MAG: hypothetical protein P4L50_24535 [Anaerolineaceae bacterium]|nr:hypothetical protein [Anaerolineaceae bacterium]
MRNTLKNIKIFRWLTLATLCGLVLEFILGMYTSLFVQFPDSLVNGNGWVWAMKESPIITAHIFLGTLLVLLGVLAVIFGIASHSKPAILWSVIGLVTAVFAYLNGSVFLSNVAENNYSFFMALGFMGSMVSYGLAYFGTRLDQPKMTA